MPYPRSRLVFPGRNAFRSVLALCAFASAAAAAAMAEDYSQWTFAREFSLDASGLAQDLAGYPLLVRFGPDNSAFFAKALPKGADLRFSLPDGTHLAYQIETWEPAQNAATVWVRIPLVKAGQGARVRAHCGRPGAADSSDGAAVFRTAEGFQGIWHMQASLEDATANRVRAMDSGGIASPAGHWGTARYFDNPDAYATQGKYLLLGNPAALNFAGALTLSAWISWGRRDGHRIILCHGSSPGSSFETVLRIGESKDYRAGVWTGAAHYAAVAAPAADSAAWIHLGGAYTGKGWILYRNGEQVGALASDTNGAKPSPGSWRIGAQNTSAGVTRFFHGSIDEVRISNAARSADWFKLDFATQQAGSAAVHWDPATTLAGAGRGSLARRAAFRMRGGAPAYGFLPGEGIISPLGRSMGRQAFPAVLSMDKE